MTIKTKNAGKIKEELEATPAGSDYYSKWKEQYVSVKDLQTATPQEVFDFLFASKDDFGSVIDLEDPRYLKALAEQRGRIAKEFSEKVRVLEQERKNYEGRVGVWADLLKKSCHCAGSINECNVCEVVREIRSDIDG